MGKPLTQRLRRLLGRTELRCLSSTLWALGTATSQARALRGGGREQSPQLTRRGQVLLWGCLLQQHNPVCSSTAPHTWLQGSHPSRGALAEWGARSLESTCKSPGVRL